MFCDNMEKKVEFSKLVADIREITRRYRGKAAIQLNATIIDERWEIGKRIVEEEQNGEIRAEYGTNLLKELSAQLTFDLGKGYSQRSLAYYRLLYLYFPDRKILQTRLQNLTWSHIQAVLGEKKDIAKYSMLNGSKQLFASKYLTVLPSEEELRAEIETQKHLFLLQRGEVN